MKKYQIYAGSGKMTEVRKPISPIYIEMVEGYGYYKVQALCNLCDKPMLTNRFYCPECHKKCLLKKVCVLCGDTFRSYTRKYCSRHTLSEIHKYGARKTIGVNRQAIMEMEGTQSAIARAIGVSRQRVHQILSGAMK